MRQQRSFLAVALICLGSLATFASEGGDNDVRRFTLKASQRGKISFERSVAIVLELGDKPLQVTLPRTPGLEHPDLHVSLARSNDPKAAAKGAKESYLVTFSLKNGESLLDLMELGVSLDGGTASARLKDDDKELTYEVTIESVRKPSK